MEISALTTRRLHWCTGIAQILGVADGRHGDAVEASVEDAMVEEAL